MENPVKATISQEIPIKNQTPKIISQEIPKEEKIKTVEKQEPITTNKITIDYEKLNQLKELRINNTLSKFHKKTVIAIKEKLNALNNYLLDPDYSKYASMLLDGILKAASEDNLI